MPPLPSDLEDVADLRSDAAAGIAGLEMAVRARSTAVAPGPEGWTGVRRLAANRWGLASADVPAGSPAAGAIEAALWEATRAERSPAEALRRVDARLRARGAAPVSVLLANVEQDVCGAWITLGVAGHPLPVVVRRAGWIDVRGQAAPCLGRGEQGAADDRVGLGPGDAIVVCDRGVTDARDRTGERFAEEALLDALLDHAGDPAGRIAEAVAASARAFADEEPPDAGTVLALRVPPVAAEDPERRLRAAIGADRDDLPLPGYPVGQPHWGVNDRPAPPREARLRLRPELVSVPTSRRFVDGVLHSWRLSALAGDDVALCTSELVTNAVRHSGAPFAVIVRYDGTSVRVEVGDGSRALPRPRTASGFEAGGRGLAIVELLAADWGVQRTVDGKRVWFAVLTPPEGSARGWRRDG